MPKQSPEEIVTDAELSRAAGNANFGPRPHREILARGVLQTAAGFHTGGTLRAIMRDLGLITDPLGHRPPSLRKKGRAYLWAVYGGETY